MSNHVLDNMRARAHAARTRALVRGWTYRQRHLAAGVWFRLRRVLSDARAAYLITDEDARRLIDEGYTPEPSGLEVAPEKMILFIDEPRLSTLDTCRPIPVTLGPEFMAARAIALLAFDDARRRSR